MKSVKVAETENAFHLSDWMQRPPLDLEDHRNKTDRYRSRLARLGKSHRQTHLKAEFICFHFKSDWCRARKKNCFINQMSLVFFYLLHFLHRRFIVQIKRNTMHIFFVCSCLLFFFSTCDALHKGCHIFFLNSTLRNFHRTYT